MRTADLINEINDRFDRKKKTAKAEMIRTFSRIISESAYDEGRYRSNWKVSLGAKDSGEEEVIKSVGETTAKATSKANDFNLNGKLYFQNNLKYANKIEYVYSEYKGRFRAAVAELKNRIKRI